MGVSHALVLLCGVSATVNTCSSDWSTCQRTRRKCGQPSGCWYTSPTCSPCSRPPSSCVPTVLTPRLVRLTHGGFVSTRLLIRAPLVLTRATGGEEESVPHLAGVPAVVQSRLLSTFCERQVGKSGRTRCVHCIPPWMAGVCPLTRSGLAVLSARNCCVTSCCCTCVRWL